MQTAFEKDDSKAILLVDVTNAINCQVALQPKVMPRYITYYTVAHGNEGLYPLAFRYSHLDTRYSHLQLPVVALKCFYNLSNHLATGYNYKGPTLYNS